MGTNLLYQRFAFREELISQIPALQLLMAMGYHYLTPDEALRLRGNKPGNVILEEVLEERLQVLNWIEYKGNRYPFSQGNIRQAIDTLKNEPYDGLVSTNERIYELLTLGASLRQTIQGDTKSYSLHYVDWQQPENNVYHVTDEFPVEKMRSKETRRPDIVCFVNGIPLIVIECKRPDLDKRGEKAITEAITQMIRNQKDDEIPNLFIYSQLLLAASTNDAMYGTTFTPRKFWSLWQEESDIEAETHRLINCHLPPAEKDYLYNHRDEAAAIRRHFDELEAAGERLPTGQDRTLYSLLRPRRLLELIYQFIVYDGGVKKIARYQQYFAIKATLNRVAHLNHQQERTGGVIWHTTGSGKSLTMVMLAKALALHPNIKNPRVVLVTDRIDLDDQIWRTFRACGKKAEKAQSGRDLIELVQAGNVDIITTVINKFEAAAKERVKDTNPNVFVLVDEGHRSQYGTIHAKMWRVFKKACYIAFDDEAWQAIQADSTGRQDEALLVQMAQHPLFCRHDRAVKSEARLPLSVPSVQYLIKQLADEADVLQRFNVSPHSLRHYFANGLLEFTGNLALVQEALGHQDPKTTRVYTQVKVEEIAASVRAMSDEAAMKDE